MKGELASTLVLNTNHIDISVTPKRIISLVPSQTELLYDLGLEESIVGITKFCVHPFHFKSTKQIIGGTKNIKIDKIKQLNPDIILCNKEENTPEIVAACQEICQVHVSDIVTIQDCLDLINDYGVIFKKSTNAQRISDKIRFHLNNFETFIKVTSKNETDSKVIQEEKSLQVEITKAPVIKEYVGGVDLFDTDKKPEETMDIELF